VVADEDESDVDGGVVVLITVVRLGCVGVGEVVTGDGAPAAGNPSGLPFP